LVNESLIDVRVILIDTCLIMQKRRQHVQYLQILTYTAQLKKLEYFKLHC